MLHIYHKWELCFTRHGYRQPISHGRHDRDGVIEIAATKRQPGLI